MTISERKSKVSTSATPTRARVVSFGDDMLVVDLVDGRRISVPIGWFPRLAEAMTEQPRELINWRLIGGGIGIRWPGLDEHVSVENLLANRSELLTYHDTLTTEPRRARRPVNPRGLGLRSRAAVAANLRDPRTGRFGAAAKPAPSLDDLDDLDAQQRREFARSRYDKARKRREPTATPPPTTS